MKPNFLAIAHFFLLLAISSAFSPLMGQTNRERRNLPGIALRLALDAPIITLEDVSCSHDGGDNWQLEHVSYILKRGAKVALVGRNGAGKSVSRNIPVNTWSHSPIARKTLLRIIAEQTCLGGDELDTISSGMRYTGQVTSLRGLKVSYVEQEPPTPIDIKVVDALLGVNDKSGESTDDKKSVYAAARRYQLAALNAAEDSDEFTTATAAMDDLSGWDVLTKADEIASKLRIHHLRNQSLSTLSGGERKRVALAAALVQEPDVLLLDEPTNFLSLAGVQWLANLLTEDKKLTFLMVTHDRAFLDEYEYIGKYSDFLTAKEDRLARDDALAQASRTKLRRELEWMRRQPQARESKSKARIDAFYTLQKSIKPKAQDSSLSFGSRDNRRVGGKILSARNLCLQFGGKVIIDDFSYDFCKGDRICVSGANGAGKTTFINVLCGKVPPDSGSIDLGETIVLGVYDQRGITIQTPEQTVLDFVSREVSKNENLMPENAIVEARRLLQKFDFPSSRWSQRLPMLSGGERRRLQLISVLSEKPNFLILDEPSVDLDISTLQALETYLSEDYEGVLLVVSHDRYFADKCTDHLFLFEGDGSIKDFTGSLSDYASCLVEIENNKFVNQKPTGSKKDSYKDTKRQRNEQRNNLRQTKRDLTKIERKLDGFKSEAERLEGQLETRSGEGWSVLAQLTDELNLIKENIDQLENTWLELAESVEAEASVTGS